jgi:DnaJ-class molecular chaperone
MSTTQTKTSRRQQHEEIRCAFCHGQGTDPFGIMSDRSVCGACGGRGVLNVSVPHMRCAYCEGTGSFKTFRCPVCEGAGVIPAPEEPIKTCPSCDGLAFERSSGLVCLTCHGRGVVPA